MHRSSRHSFLALRDLSKWAVMELELAGRFILSFKFIFGRDFQAVAGLCRRLVDRCQSDPSAEQNRSIWRCDYNGFEGSFHFFSKNASAEISVELWSNSPVPMWRIAISAASQEHDRAAPRHAQNVCGGQTLRSQSNRNSEDIRARQRHKEIFLYRGNFFFERYDFLLIVYHIVQSPFVSQSFNVFLLERGVKMCYSCECICTRLCMHACMQKERK